jgi:hypothetical protein
MAVITEIENSKLLKGCGEIGAVRPPLLVEMSDVEAALEMFGNIKLPHGSAIPFLGVNKGK